MAAEIQEYSIGRYMRLLIKSVLIFSIVSVAIVFLLLMLFEDYIAAALSAIILILLYVWAKNNRMVKIKSVNSNSVVLVDGNREVELKREFISHVSKLVRFTVTQNFLLCIVLKNGNILTSKRYLFCNDQRNNVIEMLKNIQIELRNIP